MQGLSINLIPAELGAEELRRKKFIRVQIFGISAILLLAFLASVTISLRILQQQDIRREQERLSEVESRVTQLKNREASLFVLKNRLATASRFLETPSKQVIIFNLVNSLLPSSIAANSMVVDRSGNISVSAATSDSAALDSFLDSLVSKETNQDKVSQVVVESLSRARDGTFRVNFKVVPK